MFVMSEYFEAVHIGPYTEKEHQDISFPFTSSEDDDWLALGQLAA